MTATTVAAMAVLVVLTAGPATAKEFATLRILAGTVEVQKGAASDFEPAADGQTLRERNTVRTGSDGRAEIEYFDGSITRLDFDTTFRLKRLESNPDEPGSKVIVAEQESGRSLERVVALTGSESRFDVEAPTATASVLGTEYVLTVHPDGSTELWVTDGEVVTTLEDGTEVIVAAGQGVRINPEGDVEGPFQLTDAQLADPWLLYNDCDLDGVEREECAEPEVEGEVIENEEGDDPPAEPPAPEPTVEPETADPEPIDNDPPAESNEPSDRRPITITLSWSSGPSNLDLHVLTPDAEDDEGGEVWHGNPCLQRSDGSCWATASGNAAAFGSESVTLSPTGSPEPGDWAPGPYDIWVENFSCSDGTYEDSNATVSVSRGGSTIASMTPAGGSGDQASSTWSTGSVAVNQRGSASVAAASSFSGETCGPPEEEEALVRKGELDPENSVIQEIPVAPQPQGGQSDATGGNGGGNGGDGSPPATEPDDPPDSIPPEEEEPEPDPEPTPDPDPSPTPEPESTPTPEPSPSGSGTEEGTI